MSMFNKDPAKILKAILMTVWLSSAGLAVATAMGEVPQAKPTPNAQEVAQAAPRKGAQLRCWQGGTLLFEENAVELVGQPKGQLAKLTKNSTNTMIYLIDDQRGLCVLRDIG